MRASNFYPAVAIFLIVALVAIFFPMLIPPPETRSIPLEVKADLKTDVNDVNEANPE